MCISTSEVAILSRDGFVLPSFINTRDQPRVHTPSGVDEASREVYCLLSAFQKDISITTIIVTSVTQCYCHRSLVDDFVTEQAAVLALNKADNVLSIANGDFLALLGDLLRDFELLGLFDDRHWALGLVRHIVEHVLLIGNERRNGVIYQR